MPVICFVFGIVVVVALVGTLEHHCIQKLPKEYKGEFGKEVDTLNRDVLQFKQGLKALKLN